MQLTFVSRPHIPLFRWFPGRVMPSTISLASPPRIGGNGVSRWLSLLRQIVKLTVLVLGANPRTSRLQWLFPSRGWGRVPRQFRNIRLPQHLTLLVSATLSWTMLFVPLSGIVSVLSLVIVVCTVLPPYRVVVPLTALVQVLERLSMSYRALVVLVRLVVLVVVCSLRVPPLCSPLSSPVWVVLGMFSVLNRLNRQFTRSILSIYLVFSVLSDCVVRYIVRRIRVLFIVFSTLRFTRSTLPKARSLVEGWQMPLRQQQYRALLGVGRVAPVTERAMLGPRVSRWLLRLAKATIRLDDKKSWPLRHRLHLLNWFTRHPW